MEEVDHGELGSHCSHRSSLSDPRRPSNALTLTSKYPRSRPLYSSPHLYDGLGNLLDPDGIHFGDRPCLNRGSTPWCNGPGHRSTRNRAALSQQDSPLALPIRLTRSIKAPLAPRQPSSKNPSHHQRAESSSHRREAHSQFPQNLDASNALRR
jgi:hypothetical protein